MKKTILFTIIAVLLGTVGVTYAVADKDKGTEETLQTAEKSEDAILSDQEMNEELSEYEEFAVIADNIDVDAYEGTVVEDNQEKRVILFEDENDNEQYKTIFVKHKNFVKIISFDEGQIFAGSIDGKAVETDTEEEVEVEETHKSETQEITKEDAERATVASHIDLDEYTGKVVEDNKNKRVIVYEDANGHKQYKSIFVKKKDFVKVVKFDGGLIYKGSIDKGNQETKAEKKTEKKVEKKQEKASKKSSDNASSISEYTESSTIANHIDLNKYSGKVVEDNKGKRIIVFSDSNGHKQYKSIYVKRNGYLKIIDFNGGMIYNGK